MCDGKIASSTNNLTLHKELMREWSPANTLDPRTVTQGSKQICMWLCLAYPKEHKPYPQTPERRVSRGQGCPSCAGHRVTETNSLASRFPEIASQLDPTRHPYKAAEEVSYSANEEVWWRCPVWPSLHAWRVSPNSRTSQLTGCPCCATPHSSKQQIRLMCELAHVLSCDFDSIVVPEAKMANGHPAKVDLYVERLRLAIEFDGSYWHRDSQVKDASKTEAMTARGITVIRVRESPLEALTANDVVVQQRSSAFDQAVLVLAKMQELGLVSHEVLRSYVDAGQAVATAVADDEIQRQQANGRPTIL